MGAWNLLAATFPSLLPIWAMSSAALSRAGIRSPTPSSNPLEIGYCLFNKALSRQVTESTVSWTDKKSISLFWVFLFLKEMKINLCPLIKSSLKILKLLSLPVMLFRSTEWPQVMCSVALKSPLKQMSTTVKLQVRHSPTFQLYKYHLSGPGGLNGILLISLFIFSSNRKLLWKQ